MRELLRSNDPVELSFLEVLLRDSGIESVVFDSHTSIVEGSLGVLPRRMMVLDEDYDDAMTLLVAAGKAERLD